MNRFGKVLVLAAICMLLGADDGARRPAARLAQVKGKVSIITPENIDRAAAMYETTYADDHLVVAKDSSVVLVFRADRHFERITKPGKYEVTTKGCRPEKGVERLAAPKDNPSVPEKVIDGPQGIMEVGATLARSAAPGSKDDGRSQIAPIPDSTILSEKPGFSWPAAAKAAKYTVNVYQDGRRAWSADSDTTKLSYPNEKPLKPGTSYSWEVTTTVDGKTTTICDGMFAIASAEQRASAEALEKLVAKPEVPYLAVAAMWYQQNSMVREAIALNERLARLTDDAGIYEALVGLYWQAGRDEDARRATEKAMALEKKAEGGGETEKGGRGKGEGGDQSSRNSQ